MNRFVNKVAETTAAFVFYGSHRFNLFFKRTSVPRPFSVAGSDVDGVGGGVGGGVDGVGVDSAARRRRRQTARLLLPHLRQSLRQELPPQGALQDTHG